MAVDVAAEVSRHPGRQMCARCSWTRSREAALREVRGRTARTGFPVALVVGTVLSLMNHGSTLLADTATTSTWVGWR